MTKTAKIKQFKYAFIKPKQTNKEVIKSKTNIEKAIKKLKKGGNDEASESLTDSLQKLNEHDEEYTKELIQYKLVKHWDDPQELNLWLTKCSTRELNVELIRKILTDNKDGMASEEMVIDCWRRMKNHPEIVDVCHSLFPDAIEDEMFNLMKHGQFVVMPKQCESKLTRRVFLAGNGEMLDDYYRGGVLNNEDAEDCVKADATGFVKLFVNGQSAKTKLNFLSNKTILEAIKGGGKEYEELVKEAPLFAFLDKAKRHERPAPNKAEKVINSLFAEVLAPDGVLGLTYYTNSMTSIQEMLATKKEDQVKAVQQRKEGIKKSIEMQEQMEAEKEDPTPVERDRFESHPDGPGTQCDVLVTLMTTLIGATLGPDVECKHKVFKGMVLTDKMSKFPGGLLSSSFGGNVYDDSGKLTGQVLFTGGADDGVSNAHTILEVNGMQYDAVLGTSGKDLSHTVVDEYPAWDKTGYVSVKDGTPIRVSKSTKTAYWIINEPGLKAAPNKHGFGSAYRMTNKPEKYIKPKPTEPTESDESSESDEDK